MKSFCISVLLLTTISLIINCPILWASWEMTTIDSVTDDSRHTSIALDRDGNPHISYHYYYYDRDLGRDHSLLRYARKTGASWLTQTVDSAGKVGKHTSIALDSSNYPHISYFDYTSRVLKYAKVDRDHLVDTDC